MASRQCHVATHAIFPLLSLPAYSCPSASSPGIRDQALSYGNPPPLYHPPPRPRSCLRGPNRFTHQPLLKRAWLSFSRLQSVGIFSPAFYTKTTGNRGMLCFPKYIFYPEGSPLFLEGGGIRTHLMEEESKQKTKGQQIFLIQESYF